MLGLGSCPVLGQRASLKSPGEPQASRPVAGFQTGQWPHPVLGVLAVQNQADTAWNLPSPRSQVLTWGQKTVRTLRRNTV